jgi:hypothetical protein
MRQRRVLKRFAPTGSLAALWLASAIASPASAAVTIGQLGPDGSPPPICSTAAVDQAQPSVSSGNPYVIPATAPRGTITSWSHNATGGPDQTLTMKIFRKVAEPATYMVVAHDGPRPLAPSTLNTFPTSIPVKPGDLLGFNQASGGGGTQCRFPVPGEPDHPLRFGNLADGDSGDFIFGDGGYRLNISAVLAPTNTFTLGATSRNKKKGTATLTATVPNPGELTGSGNGVKASSAGRGVISESVGAGQAQLLIKAKGKKKKQLNQKGKVKLSVAVTYTPTGGDPSTQSIKVKLKKNP